MKLKNKKGFTLIELLVVIVILSLLVIVAFSVISSVQVKAKESAMRTEGNKIISKMIEDMQVNNLDNTSDYKFTYAPSVAAKLPVDKKNVKFTDSIYNLYIVFDVANGVGKIEDSTYCIEDNSGAMTGKIDNNTISGEYESGKKCKITEGSSGEADTLSLVSR